MAKTKTKAKAKAKPAKAMTKTKTKAKKEAVDFDALEAAMLEAARAGFAELRENNPRNHFYGMALFTSGELSYVGTTAMSEEGLAEAVASYRRNPRFAGKTEQELGDQLRWSPADSPHHDEVDAHFGDVNALLWKLSLVLRDIDVTTERARFDAFVARTHEVFYRVLHALDEEGCFGTGEAREEIFVSMMMGDQDRSVLALGERLNPKATFERYRDQAFGAS